MSRLLDDEQELEPRDRELTLSTGAILAIFVGLVLLCAVFFGFGYNLGRKSTTIVNANVPASTEENSPASETNFDSFKPASATSDSKPTPAASDSSAPVSAPAAPVKTTVAANRTGTPRSFTKPAPATIPPKPVAAQPSHNTAAQPASTERAAAAPAPAVAPGGAFVVQIAAVSHKEDADLLVTALRAKGYAVAARPSTQDNLQHIQVGPFATRTDAEAMRERLIMDGYNAIVK